MHGRPSRAKYQSYNPPLQFSANPVPACYARAMRCPRTPTGTSAHVPPEIQVRAFVLQRQRYQHTLFKYWSSHSKLIGTVQQYDLAVPWT
eukprot:3728176-Rhodomonas_salina.1